MLKLFVYALLLVSGGSALALDVVASVLPVHSLVAGVMRGVDQPVLLVPANAPAHGEALRPSSRRSLANAQIVFWVGPGMEPGVARMLEGEDKARSVALIKEEGMQLLLAGDDAESIELATAFHEADPHIWLMPDNARVMTRAIARELKKVDPDNAAAFERNAADVLTQIDVLETDLENHLKSILDAGFAVYHDAYRGLQKRFGLRVLAIVSIDEHRGPGAKHVSRLRALFEQGDIQCLFVEPGPRPKLVDALIVNTPVKVAQLDPLGRSIEPGPKQWFKMMQRLGQSLYDCLH